MQSIKEIAKYELFGEILSIHVGYCKCVKNKSEDRREVVLQPNSHFKASDSKLLNS